VKKTQWLTAVLVSAALALTACSGGGGSRDDAGKDEIVFADTTYWGTWQNQSIQSYQSGNVAHSLLARLVYNDAEKQQIVPWLAEKFSANDDYTEFTFTLRPGVTFSDGTKLDAKVVKANFDLWGHGDEKRGIIKGVYFGDYDHTEIVDDSTVKVFLKDTDANFLYALSAVFYGVQSQANLDLSLEEQQKLDNIKGAGPYVLDHYTADQEIVLKRRDDYAWAPETSENQGKAHIEKIVFRYVPEISSRSGAIVSGQADLARVIHPDDEKRIKDSGGEILPVPGYELTAYLGALRPDNPQLRDLNVRRALQYTFNIKEILSTLATDSYPAPTGIFTRSEDGVDVEVPYDPDRARQLLDDAGWKPGKDGIREKDGVKLKLDTDDEVQSPASLPIWEAIAQDWRKQLGVELVIHKGDVQYSRNAWYDPKVPVHLLRQWNYDGTASLFGGRDGVGFSVTLQKKPDQKILDLAKRERKALDPAEQKQIRKELNQYVVLDQAYVLPTFSERQIFASNGKVDVPFTGATYPDFYNATFK